MHTGMRLSETLCLRWQDIDYKTGIITLPESKSGFRRVVANSYVMDLLKEIPKSSLFVFPGNQDGHASKWNVSHQFKAAVNRAGIENLRFHDLRHDYASRLAMAGVSLQTISELLGHHSLTMSARYAHLSPDYKKRVVEILVPESHRLQEVDTIWTPDRTGRKVVSSEVVVH